MPEEPQLNGRIASVIREISKGTGWVIQEEIGSALRGPRTKPDILIIRPNNEPPIVIENEYEPATSLESDCFKSLGRELNPKIVNGSGIVNTVIAIRSPLALKDSPDGDSAQQLLVNGQELCYAVYHGDTNSSSRFPPSGFVEGNIRNLVEFMKPAIEARNTIEEATDAFENGTDDAAAQIEACPDEVGVDIGKELKQPWPLEYDEGEPDKKATQRNQTAKMAAAIMINALAYQQNLAGHQGIKSLAVIRDETGITQSAVSAEWDRILKINYWPIFHIAKRILLKVSPEPAKVLLSSMSATAEKIQEAIKTSDVAGTVFQRLISDRQTLATYYTRPESTTLAAFLSIPDKLDWSNPQTLRNYRIADYACGTGGLVLAAYQRVRELHRIHGGDPNKEHAHMMQNSLTACDIMPAAVHLSASLLSSVAPREHYSRTRCVLYGYGETGEKDAKGNPVVNLGSLELLDLRNSQKHAVLPLSQEMAVGSTDEVSPIQVDMAPLSQDLN